MDQIFGIGGKYSMHREVKKYSGECQKNRKINIKEEYKLISGINLTHLLLFDLSLTEQRDTGK